jgi:hypothetical protein
MHKTKSSKRISDVDVGNLEESEVSGEHIAVFFRIEYGGIMFLRNIGIYLQVHAALLLRKPASTSSPS